MSATKCSAIRTILTSLEPLAIVTNTTRTSANPTSRIFISSAVNNSQRHCASFSACKNARLHTSVRMKNEFNKMRLSLMSTRTDEALTYHSGHHTKKMNRVLLSNANSIQNLITTTNIIKNSKSMESCLQSYHTTSAKLDNKNDGNDTQKVPITYIDQLENEITVQAKIGENLLDVAHENNIELEGACGGELACATCHLIFEEDMYDTLDEKDPEEDDMLDLAFELTDTSRLGCQIRVREDMAGMTVRIPDDGM